MLGPVLLLEVLHLVYHVLKVYCLVGQAGLISGGAGVTRVLGQLASRLPRYWAHKSRLLSTFGLVGRPLGGLVPTVCCGGVRVKRAALTLARVLALAGHVGELV